MLAVFFIKTWEQAQYLPNLAQITLAHKIVGFQILDVSVAQVKVTVGLV